MVNYLDRRRGARGMNAKPSLPDPQNAVRWLGRIAAAVAHGAADDRPFYGEIQSALAELCGCRALTLVRATPGGDGLQRVHSSHAEAFPVNGIRPMAGDPWVQHLMATGDPELSSDAEAVRRHFFDAQAIFDLGCESVLNVPIRLRGRNLGILTLMHRAHWYAPSHVNICLPFAALIGAAWVASPQRVTP